jgi:alanyl-tRNA synthetase
VHVAVFVRPGIAGKDLQELMRRASKALAPLVGCALSPQGDEVQLVAVVDPAHTAKLKAGDLIKAATSVLGGGGGGRPEMAQGKGTSAKDVEGAAAAVRAALQAAGW